MQYLNIPGLFNSGPQHWQTLWENLYPGEFDRVEQSDWVAPEKDDWVITLNKKIQQLSAPTLLVGHSLGSITVIHWASQFNSPWVKGAVLVAPADVERRKSESFESFNPVPLNTLPFPSAVIASTNDPYASIEQCAKWAAYWGSKFISAGDKGHINAESGLGQWEEGLTFIKTFGKTVAQVSEESLLRYGKKRNNLFSTLYHRAHFYL
jgi:predicted alpha/beta hydrolase family esterase